MIFWLLAEMIIIVLNKTAVVVYFKTYKKMTGNKRELFILFLFISKMKYSVLKSLSFRQNEVCFLDLTKHYFLPYIHRVFL
jgi:hypothetical protein